jgi:hypothetical protein
MKQTQRGKRPSRPLRAQQCSALGALFLSGLMVMLSGAVEAESPRNPPAEETARGTRLIDWAREEANEYFIDPDDGNLDVSRFLSSRGGFVPVPLAMTEPTLGYGGGAILLFLQPRQEAGKAGYLRPNATGFGAIATENGTWIALAGDSRYWLKGRVKTLGVVLAGRIRLDFYGLGHERILGSNPLEYQLNTVGTRFGGQYRLGDSDWWLGLTYEFVHVKASFGEDIDLPRFISFDLGPQESRLSGPGFKLTYDSRNSIFTPTKGLYSETNVATGWDALGGTTDYQKLSQIGIGYFPLSKSVFLGLRADLQRSFGSPPFYIEPALSMRGIPALRYQGRSTAQGQVELRWQFGRRFSVLGFMGGGGAWNKDASFRQAQTAYAGGVGVRYELAKLFRLHYGIDFAYGTDGGTFYFQLGSAWTLP